MQKFTKEINEADIPDVDFYIMKYDDEKQRRLTLIRNAIKTSCRRPALMGKKKRFEDMDGSRR